MRLAVVGCVHGDLDGVYEAVKEIEQDTNVQVDAILCCGDFQAVRNLDDLQCMAVPDKYKKMNSFHAYYSGQKKADRLTIFIGGNHEAINHLWELYYGGWVAHNMYFLGFAGVIQLGGLRIAGISGIYHDRDYRMGHFEFQDSSLYRGLRSSYHVREMEVDRLLRIKQPVDIFLSHDWPKSIQDYGDREGLLREKPYFRKDMETGRLGNPALEGILHALRPAYWFAAHLHVKFAAMVHHPPLPNRHPCTKFLALDKPIPGRNFLQVVDIPASGSPILKYDPEWLSILCTFHDTMSLQRQPVRLPRWDNGMEMELEQNRQRVDHILAEKGDVVPQNFAVTAPTYNVKSGCRGGRIPQSMPCNPQTVQFLGLLGLSDNLHLIQQSFGHHASQRPVWDHGGPPSRLVHGVPSAYNPEEIDLGSEEETG